MVQELTVRLGIYTGRGHGELIRERFGLGWACAVDRRAWRRRRSARWSPNSPASRESARLYRPFARLTLPLGGGCAARRRRDRLLPAGGAGGDHHRPVRTGLLRRRLGGASEPRGDGERRGRSSARRPRLHLHASRPIIGATFNPWMIFYQQSAIASTKSCSPADLAPRAGDTAFGAVLTQCLTGRRAGRRGGGAFAGSGSGEPFQRRRDQPRADPGFGRERRAASFSAPACSAPRWSPRSWLAGARLGRRRDRRLPAHARDRPVRGEMVLWRLCASRGRLGRRSSGCARSRLAQRSPRRC